MAAREVEFAHVSFTPEGGRSILRDVSFAVAAGSTTALLGRSGSGKTTLLRTVNALVRPTSGCVLVGSRDVAAEDVIALRRGIGYVIQESGLFPHMTVNENVRLPLDISGDFTNGRWDEADSRVDLVMGQVGLEPREYLERYPWQLSGGQRQRAGVARALVRQPGVLLMDEPFGALDPLTRAEMQAMLKALLRNIGTTTLIVTHDLDEALYLADHVVLMHEGAVVADVAVGDVMTSENEAMRAYVAAAHRNPTHDDGAVMNGAPKVAEL